MSINQELYNYAADLLYSGNKNSHEVKSLLIEKGLSDADAKTMINDLQSEIQIAKKKQAQKDVLWGAVWCIGGLIGTFSNTGFIFWGAIVFGGIQLIKGIINLSGK
ncbi:MAG: hypothetical protein ACRCVT_14185 [Leadbetterella sp.]